MNLKINSLLFAFGLVLFATPAAAQLERTVSSWSEENTVGHDSIDVNGLFVTHKRPADYPYMEGSPTYTVSVNHSYSAIYNDVNWWKGQVNFTSFEFEDGKEVEVDIASKDEMKTFEVLPHFAEVSVEQTSPYSIKLRLSKANQKLTLIANGKYKGDVLHIFANSIDHEAPVLNEQDIATVEKKGYLSDRKRKLLYFGKGYFNVSNRISGTNGTLNRIGNWQIYLAPGAVVEGQMRLSGVNGAKLSGRGMLMNTVKQIVLDINGQNSTVDGILIHGHRGSSWCTTVTYCKNVSFNNVKIITTRYASVDGLDVVNSSDCHFENMFIRSCDDAVAIKAGGTNSPANGTPNKNLFFNRMQLWNDCNNAFGLGAETRAPYENIHLTNSEVLFSYDDPYNHEQLDERSAMNICCLHGTTFKNISFENIYVNRCERLIGLGFKSSFWFGSIQGDQSYPGEISGVTFKNITSPNNSGSTIANQIHLYGWEATDGTTPKKVTNITFDNVLIEGKLLNNENDAHIVKNSMVDNLHFTQTDGIHTAQSHNEVVSLSTAQGTPFLLEGRGASPAWTLYSYEGSALKRGNGAEVPTIGLPRAHYLLRVVMADGNSQTFKVTVK